MDRSRRRVLMGILLLAAGTLVFGIPSHGDTYRLISIGNAEEGVYGIDNVGNAVISTNFCFLIPSLCFETFYFHSGQTLFSATPPSLHYDNRVGCIPSTGDPQFVALSGVCNNGHEIFEGAILSGPNPEIFGVWTGPDPVKDILVFGNSPEFFGEVVMNRLDDAVFIDGLFDNLYYAEDLTTIVSPEPGTLFLVGSGGLMLLALLIRRAVGRGKELRREQCLP